MPKVWYSAVEQSLSLCNNKKHAYFLNNHNIFISHILQFIYPCNYIDEIQIVAIIQYQILSKYNTTAEPMTTHLTGYQAPVCSKYQKHLTPHGHATWSRHMMQYDNTGCCPIPEPQFLLLCKGCPVKFRHAIHKPVRKTGGTKAIHLETCPGLCEKLIIMWNHLAKNAK